jgi:hypothetical protein
VKHHPQRELPSLEPLEPRRLLSGVTLITHGQGGSAGGEVARTADRIARRVGGAAQYVMTVDRTGVAGATVTSFVKDADSPGIRTVSTGEMIIKLDYGDTNLLPTTTTAMAVADYMMSNGLVEQQIHLAGPSRGGSLVSSLAHALGRRGVWVDHVTYIDPVPATIPGTGLGIDPPMRVSENVAFADNYWRSDRNILTGFDGQHVNGAHEGNLNNTVQRDHDGDPHEGAGAYYIATIDPDEPIVSPAKASWFRGTADAPARDRTGYFFSRIVGGVRPRDGLHPSHFGTAHRDGVPRSPRPQWANVADLGLLGNERSVPAGTALRMVLRHGDADSTQRIAVFLDRDRNPYNDNNALRMTTGRLSPTSSVARSRTTGQTRGAAPGTYYIYAQVTDPEGHIRYAYARRPLTITRAAGTAAADRLAAATMLTTSDARVAGSLLAAATDDRLIDDGADDPFRGGGDFLSATASVATRFV